MARTQCLRVPETRGLNQYGGSIVKIFILETLTIIFAMAGLTNMYSRLQDTQIPLKDRIALFRLILEENDCFFPNKNQVLTDWLCQELHYFRILQGKKKDVEASLDVARNQAELWKLLHEVLGGPASEHIIVRQRFLPVLLGELARFRKCVENGACGADIDEVSHGCGFSVFLCCQDMLKNSQLLLLLFNKLDNVEQLLVEVLSCFLAMLLMTFAKPATLIKEICRLVTLVLQQYEAIQRQQIAQSKLFGNLCKKLLRLLLVVKTAINDDSSILADCCLQESSRRELTSKLDDVIAGGLFHKEHIMNYRPSSDNVKSDEPSAKKQKLSGYSTQLFEVLRRSVDLGSVEAKVPAINQVPSDLWWRSVSGNLPFLLKSFLEAAKDEKKLESGAKFNFFITLYNLIPLKGGISPSPATPQADKIAILNEMLQVLLEHDVYQIAEDNLNNQPLFKQLVNLTESLMQSPKACNMVVFQSLGTLLKLNHKILEMFLEKIIERCLVKSNQSSEVTVKEKVKVWSNLVETYNKLHQIEHLIKSMLNVIKSSKHGVGPIPVEVITSLSQAFERCPLNLTLSLYQLFLDTIKSQADSLKQCSSQDEHLKKGFNGTALEAITVLFVTFLCNSSYSASDQHRLDPKKTSALREFLETTKLSVLTPLIEAFPVSAESCQKEIGFCALYLLYGLNEVANYLNRHDICICSEVQIPWNSELETFMPTQSWGNVEMASKSGKLLFCTDLLAVQRALCLLASRDSGKEELACLLTFLYNFEDRYSNPKIAARSWNGDPCSITINNYPVAHWSLVVRHSPLLLPHCDDAEISGFAKTFLRYLSLSNEESLQDDSMTVTRISEKVLEANELYGISSLQTALVKEFWEIVGESADTVIGGEFRRLTNVFKWRNSEGCSSENQDLEKDEIVENGVTSTVNSENGDDEVESLESRKDEVKAENAGVKSSASTKAELRHAASIAEGLATFMNDEAKKMAKKRPKNKKYKTAAEHSEDPSEDLREIQILLGVLQRLSCPLFTSSNQARCLLGLLACDVLAGKWASPDGQGSEFALQLSSRLSVNDLLGEVLQLRDSTAWRVVDVRAVLAWVHASMVRPDQTSEDFKLASNELLGLVVKLALKYRRPTGLEAVRDFNDQLLASIGDEIAESNATNLEIVFHVVSACVEFLQQKSASKSSASTASAVIINAAKSLLDIITLFLKDRVTAAADVSKDENGRNLEIVVWRLSGTITKAMRLLPHAGNVECKEERLRDWSQVVSLLVSRVTLTLEDEARSPSSLEQAGTCVTVLEHIAQLDNGYRDVLPEEFHSWILRICLRILRTHRLLSEAEVEEGIPGDDDEGRSKLRDAILRLFSALLEVNDGENCAFLLGRLVEASVDGVHGKPRGHLLTCLTVFKKLLANKVVKKRKNDLRPILAKVLITMLNSVTADLDVLALVLEIIAAAVTLGSGTFYPQDLALVFQALAVARDAQVNDLRTFSRLFMARFGILSWSLFYYPDHIYAVMHVFLTCVRDLLSGLLAEGSKTFGADSDLATTVLAGCGQKMSRLLQELASHKDVFSKYSSYTLSVCIHLFSTQGIPRSIRDILIEGVHYLFDVCTDDALTRVHVHLPSAERELFRSIKEDFDKHRKFKGNA